MNSKRINALFSFIEEKDLIVDVGCDHAYLSKLLEERGQRSIASDISLKIIKKRLKEKSELIKYYVSDGLENISGYYDYPVLSGMGTFTILEILKNSSLKFNKCLICSNSDNEILRRQMKELGFVVEKELVVFERSRYYNIIMFKKGTYNYTDEEYYLGINHIDLKMFEKQKKFLLNKYTELKKQIPSNKQKEIKRKIQYLK